jgi:type II secretory pathway pseudopilin PulG
MRFTRRAGEAGHLLVELLATLAAVMVLGGMAVPHLAGQRDAINAASAARHVGALTYEMRAESLREGRYAGLQFQTGDAGIRFASFVDGNRDGIRAADIARGVDTQVTTWAYLGDNFPRVAFGIAAGVTDPESGAPLAGSPLKIGGSGILSFGPDGTATSGTLYVRGPGEQQYAVRILGATGRSRVLRFDFRRKTWATL